MATKNVSVRIKSEQLQKLKYICEYNCRSKSHQIMHIINNYISEFEKEQGEILIAEKEE